MTIWQIEASNLFSECEKGSSVQYYTSLCYHLVWIQNYNFTWKSEKQGEWNPKLVKDSSIVFL